MAAAAPFIVAGLSAYSAYSQGQAQAQAAEQQAAAARRNEQLLQQQARVAREQAGAEEEAQRKQARALLATQRAAMAQAGIGAGGTVGLLAEDSALQAELDALNIRYGGELRASGLLNEAQNAGLESKILKKNASQARKSAIIGAGTSMLSSYSGGMFSKGGRV